MEGTIGTASARLCRFLHLDPTLRLHAADPYVLPESIVPEPIGLPELIAIALLNRPELKERRVDICRALLRLQEAHWLPFSPTVYIAYSAGIFGGGGSLASAPPLDEPRFGSFDGRQDFDAMAYWTLLNLGVGNRAQIAAARSRLRTAELREIEGLDRVRAEVATAYARTHARYAQIKTFEMAIEAAQSAFREDLNRIIGHKGLPLELLDSLRLLADSRTAYLNAIVDYNIAQFQLYVAIGRPPADLLMRPAAGGVPWVTQPAVPPKPQ